jgi:hypothetical protein
MSKKLFVGAILAMMALTPTVASAANIAAVGPQDCVPGGPVCTMPARVSVTLVGTSSPNGVQMWLVRGFKGEHYSINVHYTGAWPQSGSQVLLTAMVIRVKTGWMRALGTCAGPSDTNDPNCGLRVQVRCVKTRCGPPQLLMPNQPLTGVLPASGAYAFAVVGTTATPNAQGQYTPISVPYRLTVRLH